MLKRSKILALVATAVTGIVYDGCGWGLGGGFAEGFLAKGFVDKWWIDVITDWLNEDLFG